MLASPPVWPPPPGPRTVRCVTLRLLSLHQLPTRREARPLYEPHHNFVERLRDTAEPPAPYAAISSPALSVELFALGGYHCAATELGEEGAAPKAYTPHGAPRTRVSVVGDARDGLHPHFNQATVHCLASESRHTVLRIGVQDLTHNPHGLSDETDAKQSHHSQDVAYEACVLDALRPGHRCLPLRTNRMGVHIDMCCLYLQVEVSEVELKPEHSEPHLLHASSSSLSSSAAASSPGAASAGTAGLSAHASYGGDPMAA